MSNNPQQTGQEVYTSSNNQVGASSEGDQVANVVGWSQNPANVQRLVPSQPRVIYIQQPLNQNVQFLHASPVLYQSSATQQTVFQSSLQPAPVQVTQIITPQVQLVTPVVNSNGQLLGYMPLSQNFGMNNASAQQNLQRVGYVQPTQLVNPDVSASQVPIHRNVQVIENNSQTTCNLRTASADSSHGNQLNVSADKALEKNDKSNSYLTETSYRCEVNKTESKYGKIRLVCEEFHLIPQPLKQVKVVTSIGLHGDLRIKQTFPAQLELACKLSVHNYKTQKRYVISMEEERLFVSSITPLEETSASNTEQSKLQLKNMKSKFVVLLSNKVIEDIDASYFRFHFVIAETVECNAGNSPEFFLPKEISGTCRARLVAEPIDNMDIPKDVLQLPENLRLCDYNEKLLEGSSLGKEGHPLLLRAHEQGEHEGQFVSSFKPEAEKLKSWMSPGTPLKLRITEQPDTLLWHDKIHCWCAKVCLEGDLTAVGIDKELYVRVNVVETDQILVSFPTILCPSISIKTTRAFILFRLFRKTPADFEESKTFRLYFDLGYLNSGMLTEPIKLDDPRILDKTIKSEDEMLNYLNCVGRKEIKAAMVYLNLSIEDVSTNLGIAPKTAEDWLESREKEGKQTEAARRALQNWMHPAKYGFIGKRKSPLKENSKSFLRGTTLGCMPLSALEFRVRILYAKNALGMSMREIKNRLGFLAYPDSLLEDWVIYYLDNDPSHKSLEEELRKWYNNEIELGKLIPFEKRRKNFDDLFSTTILNARLLNPTGEFVLKRGDISKDEIKMILAKTQKHSKKSRVHKKKNGVIAQASSFREKSRSRIYALIRASDIDTTLTSNKRVAEAALYILDHIDQHHSSKRNLRQRENSNSQLSCNSGVQRNCRSENTRILSEDTVRNQIFSLLKIKGKTYNGLAEELGIPSKGAIRNWISGCSNNQQVKEAGEKLMKWFERETLTIPSESAGTGESTCPSKVRRERNLKSKKQEVDPAETTSKNISFDALGHRSPTVPIPIPLDVTAAISNMNNWNKAALRKSKILCLPENVINLKPKQQNHKPSCSPGAS